MEKQEKYTCKYFYHPFNKVSRAQMGEENLSDVTVKLAWRRKPFWYYHNIGWEKKTFLVLL